MIALYNLPDECTREVDDRFQDMVMREDDRFRIVRNRVVGHQGRIGAWDLIQKCGPMQGFIMPEPSLTTYCGWRIAFRLPYHSNHTVEKTAYDFVRWARANRIHGQGGSAKESAAKFWDSAKNDEDRALEKAENAHIAEVAAEVTADMKKQGVVHSGAPKKAIRAKRRKLEKAGSLKL